MESNEKQQIRVILIDNIIETGITFRTRTNPNAIGHYLISKVTENEILLKNVKCKKQILQSFLISIYGFVILAVLFGLLFLLLHFVPSLSLDFFNTAATSIGIFFFAVIAYFFRSIFSINKSIKINKDNIREINLIGIAKKMYESHDLMILEESSRSFLKKLSEADDGWDSQAMDSINLGEDFKNTNTISFINANEQNEIPPFFIIYDPKSYEKGIVENLLTNILKFFPNYKHRKKENAIVF